MSTKNIMIVGVGGQGTLLASKMLGYVLLNQGYDVKVSEVHGMSQRGGSVVTYVRYGEKVYSPVIDKGEADVILSFEKLEAARWLEYLKPGGKVIVNTQEMEPMPVITGAKVYPDNLVEKMQAAGADVDAKDNRSMVCLPLIDAARTTRSASPWFRRCCRSCDPCPRVRAWRPRRTDDNMYRPESSRSKPRPERRKRPHALRCGRGRLRRPRRRAAPTFRR